MGLALIHPLPAGQLAFVIILSVSTVMENLCGLCVIAPGAAAKSDDPGTSAPFPKCAADAKGLWIRTSGVIALGVKKILFRDE